MLYLSLGFCYVALEGLPKVQLFSSFHTGWKEPHGQFIQEISQDIQKVKDLAIGGLQNLGSALWGTTVLDDIKITEIFVNIERFTLVDAQHAPDFTGDLVFADESSHLSTQV